VAGDGIEQIHAGGHVGGVEDAGLAHGFGHEGFGGEVHDGVNFVPGENSFELRTIRKINLAKNGAGRNGGTMSLEQAVQRNDGHAARDQNFRANAADVTRRAGNKNIHLSILLDLGRKPNWTGAELPDQQPGLWKARCTPRKSVKD